MPIDCRRLDPNDAEAYAALRAEMIVAETDAFLGAPGDDAFCDPQRVRTTLASPDQAIFGAFDGPAPVAVAGVYREPRLKRRHIAAIWGVYTKPSHRGQGLSRALLTMCFRHVGGWEGVDVIQLSAAETSAPAMRLYESLGFETWGREPHGTRVNGRSITEVHMWRKAAEPRR